MESNIKMNTYKEALNEYELEDENGKIKLVYTYFGVAVYFSQVLEETFSIMLWTNEIFEAKPKTNKQVKEIIEKIENSKKTMGNFLNEIKQNYSLNEKTANDLKSILKKRNYLIHKYFKIEIQKCYSDLGRREMLEYFGNFVDETKNIDSELKKYYSEYTKKLGFTENKINELINQMKQEELDREKNYS